VVREGVALFAPLLVGVLLAYARAVVTLFAKCRLPRPLAVIVVCALIVAVPSW
jgi:predicted PurR-regulated permease PerM